MNKMGEYYSGLKRNEVLALATTGMNLESVLRSEKRRQTQRYNYCMIPLT